MNTTRRATRRMSITITATTMPAISPPSEGDGCLSGFSASVTLLPSGGFVGEGTGLGDGVGTGTCTGGGTGTGGGEGTGTFPVRQQ